MEFTLATLPPMLGLGLSGALVPWAIMHFTQDSLSGLARVAAASIVVLVLMGAALFALLYGIRGFSTEGIAADPRSAARHFLALGVKSAIIWGPVLVLTLVGLGQGIERRRGEELARRDRS